MRTEQDFIWGPWAGMGTRPLPYSIKRRRALTLRVFVILSVCAVIGGALAAVCH